MTHPAKESRPAAGTVVRVTRDARTLTAQELAILAAMPSNRRRRSWLYHHGIERMADLLRDDRGNK